MSRINKERPRKRPTRGRQSAEASSSSSSDCSEVAAECAGPHAIDDQMNQLENQPRCSTPSPSTQQSQSADETEIVISKGAMNALAEMVVDRLYKRLKRDEIKNANEKIQICADSLKKIREI